MDLEEEIRAQVDEWSSDSNECFNLTLLRNDGSEHATFNPTFTYPIFGEEQVIFGYQGLDINLTFAAHDMRPRLSISHEKAFKAIGDIKPTDIKEAIAEFLPEEAFEKMRTEDESDVKAFKPPGEKIKEYKRNGETFEIWCASLSDTLAKRILENMQILVPLLIEGGSTLELEQDWTTQRWKLFLLYQVYDKNPPSTSPYALVGYGTSYRIFTLPARTSPSSTDLALLTTPTESKSEDPPDDLTKTSLSSPLDLPSRERLSQFLILPPFQGAAHGQALYNTMYTHLVSPQSIREFTIEDPNEAFDDLRDLCDLLHLRSHYSAFSNLRIKTDIPNEKLAADQHIPVDDIVPSSTRATLVAESKLDRRQFDRLVEMQTLSHIPPLHRSNARITKRHLSTNPHDKAFYLWRLYAKQRLFVHNRDQLMQLDASERPGRVDGAVDSVQQGYEGMIEKVGEREAAMKEAGEGEGKGVTRVPRKRKIIEDEEDEDDDEAEDVVKAKAKSSGKKKAKAA